ncbi:unnamed protein product, partial [Adineta steineri]
TKKFWLFLKINNNNNLLFYHVHEDNHLIIDALQCFIRDLHWPDEMFGEHLEKTT